jgi:hypothetical protein
MRRFDDVIGQTDSVLEIWRKSFAGTPTVSAGAGLELEVFQEIKSGKNYPGYYQQDGERFSKHWLHNIGPP